MRNANRPPSRPPRRRRGYALAEVAIALLLVMAAMGLTLKVVVWVGAERRAADRRQLAALEASNVMERLAAEPFDRVTAERAKALASEGPAARALSGADWDAEVTEDRAGSVPGKRVSVRLRWKNRHGEWDAPVRLTAWVYRRRDPS